MMTSRAEAGAMITEPVVTKQQFLDIIETHCLWGDRPEVANLSSDKLLTVLLELEKLFNAS